ncbi:MAG: zinc ribbon domain-containing protein [Clostridia bacterium]|nr:zinc ribbon domain-containing protein [Clostridia bacterium]
MEWFDKVKSTVSKTAKYTKEKSTELYDITRLTFSINELETKIDKLFKNIGMLVYRDYEAGAEFSEDIDMMLKDIDAKYEEISAIKDEINSIKNVSLCPACKKTNPNDANFCLSCGEKLK